MVLLATGPRVCPSKELPGFILPGQMMLPLTPESIPDSPLLLSKFPFVMSRNTSVLPACHPKEEIYSQCIDF